MLVSNGIIPYILRLLQRGKLRYLDLNPLEWNAQTERLGHRQSYHAGCAITALLTLTCVLSGISLIQYDTVPFRAIQGFFTVVLAVFACLHWFFVCHSVDFTRLFNGLLDFEEKYGFGRPINASKARILKLLCQLQYHSLLTLAILVAFTAALAPSSPFNSYSVFYQNSNALGLSIRGAFNFLTVWIANFGLWYVTIPVLNFVISCNVAVAFFALSALPDIFQRVALTLTLVRSHLHPPEMLLRKNGQTIPSTGLFHHLIQSYRQIQLLCNLYNELHQNLIIAPLSLSSTTSQIVYLFILVTYNTQEGIIIFLFALIVFLNALAFVIACYGEAAHVHISTERAKETLLWGKVKFRSRHTNHKSRVWLDKFIKSCAPVGVAFFMNTYFDKMTPLKVELFCIDKTAVLLLVNM